MKIQHEISKINQHVLSIVLSLLLLSACSDFRKPAITGTYLNTAGSEFSLVSDTLIVEHAEGHIYLISRKTGFSLLDERGKPGALQHETEQWTAVIDEVTGVLTEQRSGKLIRFNEDHSIMQVSKRNYKRIN